MALLGLVGAILCWTGILGGELPPEATASLGVTSLAVGLWGSEIIPLSVTALLVVALLWVTGAVPQVELAFAGFSSPVLFFLLGTTGLGVAAEQTRLTDRLASLLIRSMRGSSRRLLVELLLSMPLQALFVPSAISRNAILVPIYDRVLSRLGKPRRLGAAIMLTLGVMGPFSSSALLSGGISPVAAATALGGFTWGSWLVALAPPYYTLLALGGLAVWFFTRPEPVAVDTTETASAASPGLEPAQWRVIGISVATSILWMLDQFTHWPPAIPALLALVALLLPRAGAMTWQQYATRVPWAICFVLAGAVSLADALTASGAADWVARVLFGLFPAFVHPLAMATAVFFVTLILALAIPNRAAAITLAIPLATAYASGGLLPAVAAGLIVMIAVDAETIYPAQTAATLLCYERGYFGAGELARFNLITLALSLLVILFVALPWWAFIGLF